MSIINFIALGSGKRYRLCLEKQNDRGRAGDNPAPHLPTFRSLLKPRPLLREPVKGRDMRASVAATFIGCCLLISPARNAQAAEALAHALTLEKLGISVRFPGGWSAPQEGDRVWIVNAPLAQATGTALNGLAQIFVTVEHRTDRAEA